MTVITVVAAIVFTLVVSQTILMKRFDVLEKRETRQNVKRAVSALYSDFSKVSITSGDQLTANTVIVDNGATYLRLNIDETTFNTLGLNFILFATCHWARCENRGYTVRLTDPKSLDRAQRRNDELLSVTANLQVLERRHRHIGNRAQIGGCFVPNLHALKHVFLQ